MNLSHKSFWAMLLVSIGFIVVVTLVTWQILQSATEVAERQTLIRNATRIQQALESELSEMTGIAADWAEWDDTYAFMQGTAPDYPSVNFTAKSMHNLRYSWIKMISLSDQTRHEVSFDLGTRQFISVPLSLQRLFTTTKFLLASNLPDVVEGIIVLPESTLLAVSYPVRNSLQNLPANGLLITGRSFDIADQNMGLLEGYTLNFYAPDATNLPKELLAITDEAADYTTSAPFVQTDETRTAAFWRLKDMFGKPVVAKLDIPRDGYLLARQGLYYLVIAIAAFGFLGGALVLWLMETQVIRPIGQLTRAVAKISQSHDLSQRLPTRNNTGEILQLAQTMNQTFSQLQNSQTALTQSEQKYRELVENVPVSSYTARLDRVLSTAYISPRIETMLGYPVKDWLQQPSFFLDRIVPEDRHLLADVERLAKAELNLTSNYRMMAKNGRVVWIHDEGRVVFDEGLQEWVIRGVMFDATVQKEVEAKLRHVSTYDAVTEVFNRSYFEEKLNELERPNASALTAGFNPVSLVLVDVDALKTTNDLYGHDAGDKLLKWAAQVLQATLDDAALKEIMLSSTLARIGGDEFAIIVTHPNSSIAAPTAVTDVIADKILHTITNMLSAHNAQHPTPALGMSVGIATSTPNEPLRATLKRADKAMYQQKVLRRPLHVIEKLLGNRLEAVAVSAHAEGLVRTTKPHALPAANTKPVSLGDASYQQFVEQIPAITYIGLPTLNANTIYISKQVKDILGFSEQEWLSSPDFWLQHVHPDDYERIKQEAKHAFAAAKPQSTTYRFITREGKTKWLHDESWFVYDERDKPAYVQGVLIDITQRRLAEQRSQAFSDLAAQLSKTTDPIEAARTILHVADQLMGWDASFISLCSLEDNRLIKNLIAYDVMNGVRAEVSELNTHTPLSPLSQQVMTNQAELLFNKKENPLNTLSRFGDQDRPSESLIYVPLRNSTNAIGIMSIQSYTPNAYTQDDLTTLQKLAEHCAGAISNIQLLQQIKQANANLSHAYDSTIEGWSRALDMRDPETEGHTQRVTQLVVQLSQRLGLDETTITHIRRGALLHDIGKLAIPDRILFKQDTLTPEEWAVMRTHPTLAKQMLDPIDYLKPALDIPYAHHERWDGSGYPCGLKGEDIPLAARMFAVADVWDAMRSARPYKASLSQKEVTQHLQNIAGKQLDPSMVQLFLEMLALNPAPQP